MNDIDKIADSCGYDIDVGDRVVYFKNRQSISDFLSKCSGKRRIWVVTDKDWDECVVEAVNSSDDFRTDTDNLILLSELEDLGFATNDYLSEASLTAIGRKATTKTNETGNKNMKSNIVNDNVDAAKVAAKITAGKSLNTVVVAKIKDQLPLMVRGYADTPMGAIVVANMANFAVQNFAANNSKAKYAADAMMQAAMVEFAAQFNFEDMLADVLTSVEMPEAEVNE